MRIIFYLALCFSISGGKLCAQTFSMSQIGPDFFLDVPWDLHYGPDDHLWITERRNGRVIRVDPNTENVDELITINTTFDGQSGLLGIALHDNLLTTDPYVFLSYSYLDGELRQRIVRYTYSLDGEDGTLSSPVVLVDGLPASDDHNSGRLIYSGTEDVIYYSIGDQGNRTCTNHP
jgi:glucose/arabinose dehydrogenase